MYVCMYVSVAFNCASQKTERFFKVVRHSHVEQQDPQNLEYLSLGSVSQSPNFFVEI
jgi:hypothetical protein